MDPPGAVEGRRLQKPTAARQHDSLFHPKDSLSQDNLKLGAVYDQLEKISLNPHPHAPHSLHTSSSLTSKLSVRCSCGNIEELSSSRGQRYRNGTGPATSTACSDTESDSDDDSDDEAFSLVAVIGMLVTEERKGSARRLNAIKNLAACCRGDAVSETHLYQLVRLTGSTSQQVRQAAFLALREAATDEANTMALLRMNIVPQLLTLLQDKMEAASHSAAAAVLEKIVTHRKLADYWLEGLITRGLSVLIGSLSSANQALETKVALGRLLGSLAGFFEIAVLLLDHCVEDIMEVWMRYPAMKESLTELFRRLIQHTDHTVAGVLEHRIMEHVAVALKEDSCGVQIRAAEFFQALCGTDYGLSAFLDEGKLRGILQVLRATHCRRLRELCVATLTRTLQHATTSQLREVALETEAAFSREPVLDQEGGGVRHGKEEAGHLMSRRKEASGRCERGSRVLISILVETIHKEAKLTLDQSRQIKSIGFRPGQDFYKTLSDTVCCLSYMATMTIGLQRNRTSSHNTRVSVDGSNGKVHKLSTEVVSFMFHQGALCVLDLLNTYTLHLFSVPGEHYTQQQQRNVDVLHLQAMMKVWQMVSPPSQANPLPGTEELEFVKQLMECVYLFARCSAELWNCEVEKEVKAKIEENQKWNRDSAAVDETSIGHYQYIKTVDQAFPSSFRIENITTHRQRENEMREKRTNSVHQWKMAWGDKKEPRTPDGGLSSYHHQSSNNASGDSPKTITPNKTRPQSAKKRGPEPDLKFDLNKSGFKEQARAVPSGKQREETQVKRNVRAAGYARKMSPVVTKREQEDRSAIGEEGKELQKKFRTRLFQEGVCGAVGPWVACQVPHIQALAAECLRCVIQPIHLEEIKQLRESAQAKERQNRHKSRSDMAKTLAERDKILSQVLSQMSTGSADVVRDALGVKGRSDGEAMKKTSEGAKFKTKPPLNSTNHKLTCNTDEPIGWQCAIHLLEACGNQAWKGLNSDNAQTRTACLLLVYDLVDFGETVIHMKLASLGVVSELMDFLRNHRQSQDLTLIGVMTLKNLVWDYRLKQIFLSEGGEALLTDLIKTSEGALLMHLHQFLERITEGPGGML
ncbi:uncharacterized protein LOC110974531 [Acanthaster planci]|uniref:Uncharacterized protein LOC110974531 n=1 Tax=Acanthaster planci TaxID=133434 RepID=A0A8B7XPG2_ACAPL|nr:uncharacterized protein LOC110974531 [Acanthaster planci]XP_022081942.1 uncharacterized protein LOC110974531 [Acanthaster planci]